MILKQLGLGISQMEMWMPTYYYAIEINEANQSLIRSSKISQKLRLTAKSPRYEQELFVLGHFCNHIAFHFISHCRQEKYDLSDRNKPEQIEVQLPTGRVQKIMSHNTSIKHQAKDGIQQLCRVTKEYLVLRRRVTKETEA